MRRSKIETVRMRVLIYFSFFLVAAFTLPTPAQNADKDAAPATAKIEPKGPLLPAANSKISASDISVNAWRMASSGKLDTVWAQIKTLGDKNKNNNTIKQLVNDVIAHEAHLKSQRIKNKAEFDKKIKKLDTHIKKDKTRDALASAISAQGLAENVERFMKSKRITALVKSAETQAFGFQKQQKWLKAYALYRALDLLYENKHRYDDQLDHINHRISLLQMYTPKLLFEMYKQDAKERGEDEPEPWQNDKDHWKKRLDAVNIDLLKQSIRQGVRDHVEGSTYEKLLTGALQSVRRVFSTTGLEKAFPELADKAKVASMTKFIDAQLKAIKDRKEQMVFTEVEHVLERLLTANSVTVKLPEVAIIHALGNGSMSTLDDFSAIIWPHQMDRFRRTISGKFSGVGIQISLVNNQLTVVTPLEDTPAHRAGLQPGDRIVSIDGKGTVGIDLEQAVERITGEEGTEVELGIKGANTGKTHKVKLTRSSIRIVSVKGWERKKQGGWNYYIDPAMKLGYLRLTTFGPNTDDELAAAVQQMKEEGGLSGLIVDLRFNPGGRLDAAIHVTNRFINQGKIVSTTQRTLLGRPWAVEATKHTTFDDFPVVVLINKGSASASEILSGALKVHKRALVVGENSFGKGSVQNIFPINDGAAYLKLTTAYYKIPDDSIIHRRPGKKKWGIAPDVPVLVTERQVAQAVEARMILDIVRDPKKGKFDPNSVLSKRKPKKNNDEDEPRPRTIVKSASEILERGLDPQLQTGLLLLKARLLATKAQG